MSTPELMQKQKRGLGRGLGSLLGSPDDVVVEPSAPAVQRPAPAASPAPASSELKSRLFSLGIERLSPNPKQPRKIFDKEPLESLAASIREKGILQPIVVRKAGHDSFEIIAGERRWRAAQAAGLSEVPVILKESGDQETLELALIENIQRAELTAVEEAEAYRRLAQDFLLTQQEIAKRVGKDRVTVANMLRLLELPKDVLDALNGGLISVGHAKVILGLAGSEERVAVSKEVVRSGLSVRATERLVQELIAKGNLKQDRAEGSLNIDVARRLVERLSEELQKSFGTKVSIDYRDNKGKVSIHFYSDEELSKLIERLKNV